MRERPKKYYTIGSIAKACDVLEMLATKQSWDLAELSRALKLPKTTVHRILLTFEDAGFVQQEQRGGRYGLSHKLFSLGSQVLGHSSLLDVARPFCKELLAAFDETVNVCLVSGIDMVIVDKQVTTQTLRPDNIVGASFPIFYSASGKAFLAFSEEPYIEETLRKIRTETWPPISDQAYAAFLRELEDVRKTGLGYDYEELFPGVRCIAVPVFDRSEKAVAAVSVTAPTTRLTRQTTEKIERALLKTGRDISLRLGSNHPLFRSMAD